MRSSRGRPGGNAPRGGHAPRRYHKARSGGRRRRGSVGGNPTRCGPIPYTDVGRAPTAFGDRLREAGRSAYAHSPRQPVLSTLPSQQAAPCGSGIPLHHASGNEGTMKTGLRLHWKIILAFGSAVLVLLTVCVISYRGMLVSATSEFWVRHTNEVLENLDELRFAVMDAQTSHHALVFTDKGSDLVASGTARAAAMQSESNLRLLTADNPLQQERLPRLHELL